MFDLDPRHQPPQQGADGVGAQEHRLHLSARMQQPVGEDVSTIWIRAELDFIDRDERHPPVEGHGLHRAGKPACVGGDDFFFARDEGHGPHALACDHAVIIFACEQTQRKADDATGMRQHPFDGQMRLSGVGGAEYGAHLRGGRNAGRASGGGMKGASPRGYTRHTRMLWRVAGKCKQNQHIACDRLHGVRGGRTLGWQTT